MECSERLQSNKIVHHASCIAVVRAKVEPPQHWVIDFFIAQADMLFHRRILDANWLCEVSEDIRVIQV